MRHFDIQDDDSAKQIADASDEAYSKFLESISCFEKVLEVRQWELELLQANRKLLTPEQADLIIPALKKMVNNGKELLKSAKATEKKLFWAPASERLKESKTMTLAISCAALAALVPNQDNAKALQDVLKSNAHNTRTSSRFWANFKKYTGAVLVAVSIAAQIAAPALMLSGFGTLIGLAMYAGALLGLTLALTLYRKGKAELMQIEQISGPAGKEAEHHDNEIAQRLQRVQEELVALKASAEPQSPGPSARKEEKETVVPYPPREENKGQPSM